MSRLSIRPRPLDIHKKLPIVKSFKDFEDEDLPTTSATRSSQLLRIAESDIILNHSNHEVSPAPAKKFAAEIPTPQFVVVDTYERDYSRTFGQPTSYLRGRGARAELGEFVEYDLDNEDEDWLEEFNEEKKILSPERLESILFKLEVLDHKARERAGLLTSTFGAPIPVHLQPDAAFEALQVLQDQGIKYPLFQSVYYFWKDKRERWQKPILRRLQPPPPVNDTNPYNVFRPREKAHKQHTRRMQRRENNVQSFEKLRQVRRNLEQAKVILEALIKREERKREVMETEVTLQRFHLKYKHEIELLDDNLGVAAGLSSKFGSSEDDFMDSDDVGNVHPVPRLRGAAAPPQPHHAFMETNNMVMIPTAASGAASVKQEFRRRHMAHPNHRWLQRMDPLEPVLLFTKPLVPEKLGAAGIVAPSSGKNGGSPRFRGRMGRGGRIIFDRWNPLSQSPINSLPPKPQPSYIYN